MMRKSQARLAAVVAALGPIAVCWIARDFPRGARLVRAMIDLDRRTGCPRYINLREQHLCSMRELHRASREAELECWPLQYSPRPGGDVGHDDATDLLGLIESAARVAR